MLIFGMLNIIKIIDSNQYQNSTAFLTEMETLIFKFMWNCKWPRMYKRY